MSLLAAPCLILNVGAEMMYILEQRLHAQQVQGVKSVKVLQDVTQAMYQKEFVEAQFRPQELSTQQQCREIFDNLAHSSIMRLSSQSMDKLFDLMLMAVKQQTLTARTPEDLIDVTLNHLDGIKVCAASTGEATMDLVHNTVRLAQDFFMSLNLGQLADIRHTLANFFLGRNVKISLFLQEKLQHGDGTMVVPTRFKFRAPRRYPVGTVVYYEGNQVTYTEQMPNHPHFGFHENPAEPCDSFVASKRTCTSGANVYLEDRSRKGKDAPAHPTPSTSSTSAAPKNFASFRRKVDDAAPNSQAHALNTLAAMIGAAAPKESERVKINLFHDDETEGLSDAPRIIQINRIAREDMEKNNRELMGVISDFDRTAITARAGGGGDDLLDLMDSA